MTALRRGITRQRPVSLFALTARRPDNERDPRSRCKIERCLVVTENEPIREQSHPISSLALRDCKIAASRIPAELHGALTRVCKYFG